MTFGANKINIINYDSILNKVIEIRGQKVILDTDVAALYGVETKHINQAVNRNPEKFPQGYLIELTKNEWEGLELLHNPSKVQNYKFQQSN